MYLLLLPQKTSTFKIYMALQLYNTKQEIQVHLKKKWYFVFCILLLFIHHMQVGFLNVMNILRKKNSRIILYFIKMMLLCFWYSTCEFIIIK